MSSKAKSRKERKLEQQKNSEEQLRKVTARKTSQQKLLDAAKAAEEEIQSQNSNIDLEETALTEENNANKSDSKKYTFDLKDKHKDNFRISPLEWIRSKMTGIFNFDDKDNVVGLDVDKAKTFFAPFKEDIDNIVNGKRCTEDKAREVIKMIITKSIKVYINAFSDDELSSLKVSENDNKKKKKSIFMRLSQKQVTFDEELFDDMTESRDGLIAGFDTIIKELISTMESDAAKDFGNIVDISYNSTTASKYLLKLKVMTGSRFEHVINNVIQSLPPVQIVMFNCEYRTFSELSYVPDEYLKDETDPTYISIKGYLVKTIFDNCLNLDDRKIRKYFIDQKVLEPNKDETEAIEKDKKTKIKVEANKEKVKDEKDKTELDDKEKEISDMLAAM